MVFKWEGHILSYRERVVERCVLKEETHFLSDFTHTVERQAGNVLAMDANRSRVGLLQGR